MLQGAPREKHLVRLDVDFVEQRVHYPAVLGPPHRAQVGLGDIDRRDEYRPLLGNMALVNANVGRKRLRVVDGPEIPRQRHLIHLLVRAIQDADGAESKSSGIDRPVVVHKHRLSKQHLRLVGKDVSFDALPHKLAVILVYRRMAMPAQDVFGRDEDIPQLCWAAFADVQIRRLNGSASERLHRPQTRTGLHCTCLDEPGKQRSPDRASADPACHDRLILFYFFSLFL